MNTTTDMLSTGSVHDKLAARPDKRKKYPSPPASLPYDVQEEIDCLYEFVPEVQSHFEVLNKIGEGTFSSVFVAKLRHYPDIEKLFALKHIIPTSHPTRIEGELRCLQQIGGCDNVMGVELCIRNRDHVVIVMPYFPHEKFQDYILKLSLSEVRDYIRNLLIALRRVHQFDIIHRDIKPSNFLYSRETKDYKLVDFGLAHQAPVSRQTQQEDCNSPGGAINQSQISPSKRSALKTTCMNKIANTRSSKPSSPSIDVNHSQEKSVHNSGVSFKCKQFTPPTPNLSNSVFTKKAKSPRRMLLAKRALMINKEREALSQSKPSLLSKRSSISTCQCIRQPQVCTICTARGNQVAPRAGTPGFRSPEVLLKCPEQTTAVDIWSAGVIFLSLLSGRYPFFRANDDTTALAQIISIFGSEEVKESAQKFGKILVTSPTIASLDLKRLCTKLRFGPMCKLNSKSQADDKENDVQLSWHKVPISAYDLAFRLLDLNPDTRITADEALQHPFFTSKGDL